MWNKDKVQSLLCASVSAMEEELANSDVVVQGGDISVAWGLKILKLELGDFKNPRVL